MSYYTLKKYGQANKYFGEYLEIHKLITNGCIKKGLSLPAFSFCEKDYILKYKALCEYEEKEFEKVISTFNEIQNISQKEEMKYMYIYSAIKIRRYKSIFACYENNVIKDKDIEKISEVIEKIFIEEDREFAIETAKSILGLEERIDKYIKIIYLKEKIEFDTKIIDLNNFYKWKGELVKECFTDSSQFIELFKELNKQDIILYVTYISSDYKFLEVFYKYCEKEFMSQDIESLRLITCVEEVLLVSNSIDGEKYEKLINRAYINKLNYINKIYNSEIIESKEQAQSFFLRNATCYLVLYVEGENTLIF